jgi:hypothetical protein
MTVKTLNTTYQSELCKFMIQFQGMTFLDTTETKVSKHKLFDDLYENHQQVNTGTPFIIEQDVQYQLLIHNNHPDYRFIDRKFVDFNETEELHRATTEVCTKRAIAIVRKKVRSEFIQVGDMIDIVAYAMGQAYEHFHELDKEIEKRVGVV